jgi:hypothetical protein
MDDDEVDAMEGFDDEVEEAEAEGTATTEA